MYTVIIQIFINANVASRYVKGKILGFDKRKTLYV